MQPVAPERPSTFTPAELTQSAESATFDHDSDSRFVAYYEKRSVSEATAARFRTIKEKLLALAARHGISTTNLDVLDIGCGAGTQSRLWAEAGHRVRGLDVNAPLIELARKRANEAGLQIQFDVGTATALPYQGGTVDVCLLPELLEHVADWESCLTEAVRVLRVGGLLFVSTTNVLCPVQEEFNLPLYSWYPKFIKRRIERMAISTKPALVNYAKYPAVHWFTYYGLSAYLKTRGVECFDRFDMIDAERLPSVSRELVAAARAAAPLRFLGHVLTDATVLFGIKRAAG